MPVDDRLSRRALDVDVDDPHTGRASMIAIAKAAGVTTPLVTYDQVRTYVSYIPGMHFQGMLHGITSLVRHVPRFSARNGTRTAQLTVEATRWGLLYLRSCRLAWCIRRSR